MELQQRVRFLSKYPAQEQQFQRSSNRSQTMASSWMPPGQGFNNRFFRPPYPFGQEAPYPGQFASHNRPWRPMTFDYRCPHQSNNPRMEGGYWKSQRSPPPQVRRRQFHGLAPRRITEICRDNQMSEEYNPCTPGFRAGPDHDFPDGRRGCSSVKGQKRPSDSQVPKNEIETHHRHIGRSVPVSIRICESRNDNKASHLEEQGGYKRVCIDRTTEMLQYDDSSGDRMQKQVCGDVAVGPQVQPKNHTNCSYEDDEIEKGDSNIDSMELEEEYEPEHPEINNKQSRTSYQFRTHATASNDFGDVDTTLEGQELEIGRMASCDDQGFYEAFVGICINHYPESLGRMVDVAGFGVWFSDKSASNFSGILDSIRPQNKKAVMIHSSARTIDAMKKEGYTRIRVNLESDYLNTNVLNWISKYMDNPKAQPSNWDEYKYQNEIISLCESASGMVIKWSHCVDGSAKKSGLQKAKNLATKAADAWAWKKVADRSE